VTSKTPRYQVLYKLKHVFDFWPAFRDLGPLWSPPGWHHLQWYPRGVGDVGPSNTLGAGLAPPRVSKEPGSCAPDNHSRGPSRMPAPRGNSLGHVSWEVRVHLSWRSRCRKWELFQNGRSTYSYIILCRLGRQRRRRQGESMAQPGSSCRSKDPGMFHQAKQASEEAGSRCV